MKSNETKKAKLTLHKDTLRNLGVRVRSALVAGDASANSCDCPRQGQPEPSVVRPNFVLAGC